MRIRRWQPLSTDRSNDPIADETKEKAGDSVRQEEPKVTWGSLKRLARLVGRSSAVPIYVGIAAALAGLALIAVTWGRIAAQTSVALQLPYLVSGGLTGLALVMIGMTIVNVQLKRRDAAERSRHLERLIDVLDRVADESHATRKGAKATSARESMLQRLRKLMTGAVRPENVAIELATALIAGGFLGVALAWRGIARLLNASQQIPYVVSGGLGGLALIGMGLALFAIQIGRRERAKENDDLSDLTMSATRLTRSRRVGS